MKAEELAKAIVNAFGELGQRKTSFIISYKEMEEQVAEWLSPLCEKADAYDMIKAYADESIKKRAEEYSEAACHGFCLPNMTIGKKIMQAYVDGAKVQRIIDKELIEMLINELYTSRAYHLGITGLDSDEEIKRKTLEGDCALIRGINTTIKYVREAMEE